MNSRIYFKINIRLFILNPKLHTREKKFYFGSLVLFNFGILNAQDILLSQDFSSSTNVDDYIGTGPGQLGWGLTSPNSGLFSGLAARNIADQKLQLR